MVIWVVVEDDEETLVKVRADDIHGMTEFSTSSSSEDAVSLSFSRAQILLCNMFSMYMKARKVPNSGEYGYQASRIKEAEEALELIR